MSDSSSELSPHESLVRINAVCNQFEADWRAGKSVDIARLVQQADAADRAALAEELIAIDAELRRENGQPVVLDDYVATFPVLDPERIREAVTESREGAPPASASTADLSGQTIGEYDLKERIATGGMGTVYRAEHRRLHRSVAFKLLRPEHAASLPFRQRFQREVRAAGRLSHPNIVTAYDAGEFRGVPFLVSEFIDAPDLSRVVRDDGPLSVTTAIDVIVQAAGALAYLHQHGIVHRDVKPANLIREAGGTVRLLDVGLARLRDNVPSRDDSDNTLVDDEPHATQIELSRTGVLMGTASCMPPEQASDSRRADERSDIYSLGCTLFFLITGRHCYERESVIDCIVAHRQEPIPELSSPREPVREALRMVFRRMVAKRPEDRFEQMADVIAALDASSRTPAATPSLRVVPFSPAPGGIGGRHAVTGLRRRRLDRRFALAAMAVSLVAILLIPAFLGGGDDGAGPADPDHDDVGVSPPPLLMTPFDSEEARQAQQDWADYLGCEVEIRDDRTGLEFVLIPPGQFSMGNDDAGVQRVLAEFAADVVNDYQRTLILSETPLRPVRISEPFYLSKTEVTIGQFRRFIDATGHRTDAESNDSGAGIRNGRVAVREGDYFRWDFYGEVIDRITDQHPVGNVSFTDAQAYCRWCSRDDVVCRLPTEAEWEYACRAGSASRWFWGEGLAGITDYAVTRAGQPFDKLLTTEPVASRRPNAFGVFDLHGNLAELCSDWFSLRHQVRSDPVIDPGGPDRPPAGDRRFTDTVVLRGGSVHGLIVQCRSAARNAVGIHDAMGGGIRVVRETAVP